MFDKNKVFKLTSLFSVKAAGDSDTIQISGYANTTSKDRVGDVIVENAWRQGGLDNYAKNPILLAYHNHSQPIGVVSEYSVDSGGLHVVGNVSKSAGNVYNLVKDEILKAFSVGFRIKDADYDSATDIFVIKDLELLEISVVSVPANSDSIFSLKKSFDNDEEYNEFKQTFKSVAKTGAIVPEAAETKESNNMNEAELKALQEKLAKLEKAQKDAEDARALEAATKAAVEDALAEERASVAAAAEKSGLSTPATTQAEDLMAEVEKRLEDTTSSLKETVSGLETALAEKADEIASIRDNKMSFEERGSGAGIIKATERDAAVLIAKITGKSIESTKYGSALIEKAGAHLGGMTTPADWETEFSTTLYDAIREQLVIEGLFRNIPMNTTTMNLPINPEAGYGQWIASTAFRTSTSTGTAVDHQPTDIQLTAHKLAAKAYIGYEEEEDSIIPIVGMIQDALTRQIAKSADLAFLRGDGTAQPFSGLSQLASTTGLSRITSHSIGTGGAVTVDTLGAMRRQLGIYGLNPADVIYIVSHEVYYDLLEDPDFRTLDLVGDKATILTGLVGSVNGSRVLVSGEFDIVGSGATPALGNSAAVVVNTSNFITGTLRGLMVEKDKNIEDQKNILVGTRRLGFTDLVVNQGVATLNYVA